MLKRKSDQLLALKSVPLFSSMSDKDLKAVLGGCREELYSPGQAIVTEGSPGGPFFLVVEGNAKVQLNGKTLRKLGPGDYFGEIALIDRGERTATILAESHVKALAMASWDFLAICEQDFKVAHKVMMGLCQRVRVLDKAAGH
ncbi:MAG TPA: cyclic nucleotide-binding domain-containing protein [Acidimicrobiales bacterium]|nr:cyclic nucleotide-binding domain-containing protein [Acidimicrobiales bacterium]